MYVVIHITAPIQHKMTHIFLMVYNISFSAALLGSNESKMLPIRNTNEGIPKPERLAKDQPTYNRIISLLSAREYNFLYGTVAPTVFVPPYSLVITLSTCLNKISIESALSAFSF